MGGVAQGEGTRVSVFTDDGDPGLVVVNVRPHAVREESTGGLERRVVSFSDAHHVSLSVTAWRIMEAFDGSRSLREVRDHLAGQPDPIECDVDDLQHFVETILVPNGMMVGSSREGTRPGASPYLWLRVPVVRSISERAPWLLGALAAVFSRGAILFTIPLIVANLVATGWFLVGTRGHPATPDLLTMLLCVYASLVAHELGHCAAAHRYGARPGDLGIGLYLVTPVFFVDLTSIWRLPREERLVVNAGGMYFQALSTVPLTVLALASQDARWAGISVAVHGATLMNLLPFIKLDGYWLLSDFLGLDNLSSQAFAVVGRTLKGRRSQTPTRFVVASYVYCVLLCAGLVMLVVMCIGTVTHLGAELSLGAEAFRSLAHGAAGTGLTQLNRFLLAMLPLAFSVFLVARFALRSMGGQHHTHAPAVAH